MQVLVDYSLPRDLRNKRVICDVAILRPKGLTALQRVT